MNSPIRWKTLTQVLLNLGYGSLGAASLQSVIQKGEMAWATPVDIVFGLALIATALYICPRGEA